MRAAWRAGDIRDAEHRLMATLPEGVLMRRAAAGLARRCACLLAGRGGVYGASVGLLVGAGNNGGDALFAGALLARRGAAVVAVLLVPERAHPEGLAALRAAGGVLVPSLPSTVELVVDGIVGIGARGGLRGVAVEAVEALAALRRGDRGGPIVVSVDVPSGVDVDSGAVPGPAVRADVTVTFGQLKPALVVGPAAVLAGQVELVDIGLPRPDAPAAVWLPDASDVARWWPRPDASSDKYRRGVAGLVTGSPGFPGAAILSTAGAVVGPAGMIRYVGPCVDHVVRAFPSVVGSRRVAETGRVQAWICGCGLGTDSRAQEELRAVLGSSVPVILDADALTLLSDGSLATWLRQRDAPTVVTPHDREFVRLAGEQLGPDRIEAVRRLAHRLGVVVLLKGDRTLVAAPKPAAPEPAASEPATPGQAASQTVWVNPTGSPALATAGTGDVLAGLLGSLLAAGVPADRAAIATAYVHGLAGRHAASGPDGGPAPVTAAAVAQALPAVIGSLG